MKCLGLFKRTLATQIPQAMPITLIVKPGVLEAHLGIVNVGSVNCVACYLVGVRAEHAGMADAVVATALGHPKLERVGKSQQLRDSSPRS